MSKDIHKWTDGRYTLMFDEHTFFVWDHKKDKRMTALQVTKRLNEQQATIRKLQDLCGESDYENAKLREEVNLLRPTNLEQYEQIQKLQEENEQLKIANARWLDKSLQDKRIRYSNANHKELVKKYLQLQEENASLEQRIRDIKYNNCDEQLKNKLNKHI